MKPKILLAGQQKAENYIDAVNRCGGEPIAKYCPEVSLEYDGLILCGGSDIHPSHYGEEICGSRGIDAQRDQSEFALLKAFAEAKKPILGICRGCQLLNVGFGGSLHQDLPNADLHTNLSAPDLVHHITAKEGSLLHTLYGKHFSVNSAHHQAIKKLADGFEVMAVAFDNETIEGIYHTSLPIFGVQFHPERMCFAHKREDAVDGSPIIQYFVDMCKSNK